MGQGLFSLNLSVTHIACIAAAASCGLAPPTAYAAETVTYEYDELGRLIKGKKAGGPAAGKNVTTDYDPAGNRAHYAVGLPPPPASSAASFSITGSASVIPQAGVARFTITKAGQVTMPTSVNFQTTNGSAQSPSDFVAQSGIVSFRSWETVKFVDIVVNASAGSEATETFFVQLSSPSAGATIFSGSASATIASSGPANQPPVTNFDTITVGVCEGAPAINVLANDYDPEGGALTLVSASPILGVSVFFSADGGILVSSSVPGSYQSTYVVSDPLGATTSDLLAINVVDNGGCQRRR